MKLITERLILRKICKKDFKDLIENINNIKIAKWVSTIPYPYGIKDALWWINECEKNDKEKPRRNYNFTIELKSEKKIIGGIDLIGIKDRKGEIGCWLGEKYWNQKIMSEAVNKVLYFGFNELKLRKIVWKAFVTNEASNALAKKVGFKLEGVLKKDASCVATKKIHDINIYGLLKKN